MGEVRAVSDMHQRKAEMARQADAFIALPGLSNFYICTHHYHLIQFNLFSFTSIIIIVIN